MEHYKLIQCYNCLEFCHTRNNCQNETKCSRCGYAHEYPYTDCRATPKCCNCEGPHSATARICPKYIEAFVSNEQKSAEQLSLKYPHLFTSPPSSPQPQHSNDSDISHILRAARLASKDPNDFANQLFQATSQLLPLEPHKLCFDYDDDLADDELAYDELEYLPSKSDSQTDIDNTSITAIQTHTQDTQTQMPQGLPQTHTQLQTQKPQGQTHTTHLTSITATQAHTQETQTQKPQELPQQPHTQNTHKTQHTFHSEKQPMHKFCVDTSKHLMRKPSLLIGKTPIPNTVIQLSEYVYPDLPEATSHTMSSLRNQ